MDKIGFSNFKKFKEFPSIDLAPITFIVGPNNSGKSSFIKAMTFLLYNLTRQPWDKGIYPPFMKEVSFYNDTLSHFDWGDFETTINWEAENPEITFFWSEGFFDFEFSFGTTLPISEPSLRFKLPINYIMSHLHGSCDCKKRDLIFSTNEEVSCDVTSIYRMDPDDGVLKLQKLTIGKLHYIMWLEGKLTNKPDSWDHQTIHDAIENAENYDGYTIDVDAITVNRTMESIVEEYLEYCKALSDGSIYSDESSHNYLSSWFDFNSRNIFYELQASKAFNYDFCYIETHNASHDIAISAKNKDSFLSQTVAEFYSSVPSTAIIAATRHKQKTNIHEWICKWMDKLGIGNSFVIESICGGEVYTVDILKGKEKTNGNQSRMKPLATLGTGSIQMFILLLKLAVILNDEFITTTVFIEEPEQNAHPKLQSKLADLFLEVNKITGGRVRFVVETHSEYLIRRTQVLVAEADYKTEEYLNGLNPFKVYYFPEDGMPYDMKYTLSGRFENKFGGGFFDEAAESALAISRMEREKRNGGV